MASCMMMGDRASEPGKLTSRVLRVGGVYNLGALSKLQVLRSSRNGPSLQVKAAMANTKESTVEYDSRAWILDQEWPLQV